jgi:small conductance mechanosensitive channel
MNWTAILQLVQARAASVGLQIVGAIALYIVGRWLIGLVVGAVQRVLGRQQIEPTVLRFTGNTISVPLNITLVVAILGYFGVQTTTFAVLIAAAALAIGTAWAGLLANFDAGAFLLVLRPFKVGDFISAGGVLAVRPYCHNDHYWRVYFDANLAIREVLGDAAFPSPAYPLTIAEPGKAAVNGVS